MVTAHGCPKVLSSSSNRAVQIQVPVSENVIDAAKNAGIGIVKEASLCTNQIPCNLQAMRRYPATFQLAQLALTDVT